jgi:lipopolysaccharide/colanic/teichoic acid biosynthesis glycosyltransferase
MSAIQQPQLKSNKEVISNSDLTSNKELLIKKDLLTGRERFLDQLSESFFNRSNFSISRKQLREYGFDKITRVPGKGEFLNFNFSSSRSGTYLFQKRLVDIMLSFVAILMLLPLGLLISIIILLDSGWPVFFIQKRLSHKGRKILFIKFRSMSLGSDRDVSRMKAMENFIKEEKNSFGCRKIINENLVTRSGKFLRKYSLDELPQLVSVLIGSMSLVGPRPCLIKEFDCYKDWHKLRMEVKPGCTGLWQVFGRSIVSFDESVLMDIYYSTQQNLLLDLILIIKTIPVIAFGKGGA